MTPEDVRWHQSQIEWHALRSGRWHRHQEEWHRGRLSALRAPPRKAPPPPRAMGVLAAVSSVFDLAKHLEPGS